MYPYLDYREVRLAKPVYKPPDRRLLKEMRENRLKELKMYAIIREITFYIFFVTVLLIVGSTCIDPNAYTFRNALDQRFTSGGKSNSKNAEDYVYTQVIYLKIWTKLN